MKLSLTSFLPFAILATAQTITTTLDNEQERSQAFIEQQNFIETVLLDANNDFPRYSSAVEAAGAQFPVDIMQFLYQINTYNVDNVPTGVYVSDFPFTDFKTFISLFPWVTTYMSENGMTEFKVPSDYQTITTDVGVAAATTTTTTEGTISPASSSLTTISNTSASTLSTTGPEITVASSTSSSSSLSVSSLVSATISKNAAPAKFDLHSANWALLMALLM